MVLGHVRLASACILLVVDWMATSHVNRLVLLPDHLAVLLVRHRVHLVLLVVRRGSSALRLVGHRQRLLLGRLK